MKTVAVPFAFCVLFFAAVALAAPSSKYTDKYDNVDLDEILSNRRLLIPNIKCALDQGKCSPGGKEMKEHICEALDNDCEKCTETQKKGARRILTHLINHEEPFWKELVTKYDPNRKYSPRIEKELKQ